MTNFNLIYRPNIHFGCGEINKLSKLVADYQNILIVCGKNSFQASKYYDAIIEQLVNKKVILFNEISANPKLSQINEALKIKQAENIDLVLAIGGGSVIDAAKVIAIKDTEIWSYITGEKQIEQVTDLGAILTNTATGSETNDISVVVNDLDGENMLKRSIRNNKLYPKFAILDPNMTLSVPLYTTTYGIVDTLSHIFEQYMNDKNIEIIDQLLATYFRRMMEVGLQLVQDLDNIELRYEHMFIAMQAYNGDYRTIVNGDWACHGLDYGLASEFDSTHGQGLASLMPAWLDYASDKKTKKIAQFTRAVFGVENQDDLQCAKLASGLFKDYLTSLGATTSFAQMGIDPTDEQLIQMVEKAQFVKPLGFFLPLSAEDILKIYSNCLK